MRRLSLPVEKTARTDALQRARLVRSIAEEFSSVAPIDEVWARCTALLAALSTARQLKIVLNDNEDEDDELARAVSERGSTVILERPDGLEIGVPIRFGRTVFGAICMRDIAAHDDERMTLLESCALHAGARLYRDATTEDQERYALLAYTDSLTDIANRRKFDEAFTREWSRAVREQAPISVLMLDVDYFKGFNDRYGHPTGDLCLQRIAHALQDAVKRPTDLVARYGGEEFVALLPQTAVAGSITTAEAMRSAVEQLRIRHEGSSLARVSLSIGIASIIPSGTDTLESLMRSADEHLYRAKLAGRNRVCAMGYESESAESVQPAQDSPRGNLPLQLTPLIGRASEIGELRHLLDSHRLVTIAGVGGVGKTRIAITVAAEIADRFDDGVWYADLATLSDPRLLAQTVGAPFAAKIPMGDAPFDSLAGILEEKIALLVLDTCEHLIEGVSKLANTLLHRCPRLTILATSRTPLDVAGEAIYRLPSLSLPPPGAIPTVADAASYDAVALFVDRALASAPEFRLLEENVESVVEACRRVDGIALAIEIAAARMNVLTPASLAWRLNERFHMLRRGSRTAFSRHQTMRALIDWSHDMLEERERALFERVSVFANGWNADEAAAICSGGTVAAEDVFDLLSALADKSLVVIDPDSYGERFHLLEPLRDYAAEKLSERGERNELRRAHGTYFLNLLIAGGDRPLMPRPKPWIASIDERLPDVRAALTWALDEGNDLSGGARATIAFSEYTERRNLPGEALDRLRTVTAAGAGGAALAPGLLLDARIAQASATIDSGLWDSELADVVARARDLGDPRSIASAISVATHASAISGNPVDETLVDEAIAHARSTGDGYLLGRILGLGAYLRDREPESVRACYEEAIGALGPYGDALCTAALYNNWSEFEFEQGDYARALEISEKERAITTGEPGLDRMTVMADVNRAMYALAARDLDLAATYAREALIATRGLRNPTYIMLSICAILHLAGVSFRRGNTERAAQLLGFVEETSRANAIKLQINEKLEYDTLCSEARGSLGIEGFSAFAMDGAGWSATRAHEEALATASNITV
jgi:diguanylate cyclase (GGDEF)-like protein